MERHLMFSIPDGANIDDFIRGIRSELNVREVDVTTTVISGTNGFVQNVLGNPMVLLTKLRVDDPARPDPDDVDCRHDLGIAIMRSAYEKMFGWVGIAPGEVSGFGKVVREGNLFIIKDVFLLEQRNTSASTHIDPDRLARFMRRMHKHGVDTSGWDNWWHSHGSGSPFWSGQDMQTINEELVSNRYTVSIVVNKSLQSLCRVDFYQPRRYAINGIPLQIIPEYTKEQVERFREQIEKVKVNGRRK